MRSCLSRRRRPSRWPGDWRGRKGFLPEPPRAPTLWQQFGLPGAWAEGDRGNHYRGFRAEIPEHRPLPSDNILIGIRIAQKDNCLTKWNYQNEKTNGGFYFAECLCHPGNPISAKIHYPRRQRDRFCHFTLGLWSFVSRVPKINCIELFPVGPGTSRPRPRSSE